MSPLSHQLHLSPFTLQPSAFSLQPSPFTFHPSDFGLQASPFTLHLSPSALHLSLCVCARFSVFCFSGAPRPETCTTTYIFKTKARSEAALGSLLRAGSANGSQVQSRDLAAAAGARQLTFCEHRCGTDARQVLISRGVLQDLRVASAKLPRRRQLLTRPYAENRP